MDLNKIVDKLKKFRQHLYSLFTSRRDASMELVDALSSNPHPNSVVSLSLVECYRRNYCNITRSLDEFYQYKTPEGKSTTHSNVTQLLSHYYPKPKLRQYHLFGVDCTPAPRVHAETLEDRGYVHQPTQVSGNRPVTIGHEYSLAAYLPEKTSCESAAWIWPLSNLRVSTEDNGTLIGIRQVNDIIDSNKFYKDELCVTVADAAYCHASAIKEATQSKNQIFISRLRSNRVLYHAAPQNKNQPKKRGRPKKYGEKFSLSDEPTLGSVSDKITISGTTKKKKPIKIQIESWENILMRGKKEAPMSNRPLRVMRVKTFTEDGKLLFKKPLWLMVAGERKDELSLQDCYSAYGQRFDLEHFFRFAKNRLLMDKSQTPDIDHEEAWGQFVMLAYAQLHLGKELAQRLPRPWEKYLPEYKNKNAEKTPTQVQRDFGRIIREIGTPAKPPKPRKKSKGRQQGDIQEKRTRHPVVLKKNNSLKKQYN